MAKLIVITDESKQEAIKKAATGGRMRKTFDSYEVAAAAFTKAKALAEAEKLPTYGVSAEDFPEGARAAVALVGERKRNAATGKMDSGIKALVMFAIPQTAAFIESAPTWIDKIVEKEAAHVAFRDLRNASSSDELAQAFGKMPASVEDFVASYTASGLDTDTFDAVWPELRKMLKGQMPQLVDLLPQKGEVLKAIRSKPYAMAEHAALESKGVFVWLGALLIQGAADWKDEATGEPDPQDASVIQEWLDTRDENDSIRKAAERPKDFSVLDSLDLGMAAEEDDEGGEATEGETIAQQDRESTDSTTTG